MCVVRLETSDVFMSLVRILTESVAGGWFACERGMRRRPPLENWVVGVNEPSSFSH